MSYYNHTLVSLISCVNPRVIDTCFVNFWKWKMFPSFIHVAISAYHGYLLCFVLFFFFTLTSTPHQARQPVASLHKPSLSEVQPWDIHKDAAKIRMASNISE